MEKCKVEARFGLGRGHGAIGEAGDARRVEKEAAVGLKSQGLDGADDDFGSAVLVGDVDGARAIFVVQPRVGAHQLEPLLLLDPAASP